MAYYVVASKEVVDVATEAKDGFKDAKVLFDSDEIDNAIGFILMMMENRDAEIFEYKHLKIIDDNGIEKYYQYQYAWLPKTAWIRLNPPPAELKELVKPKGEHYRPQLHQLVKEYVAAQQSA